METATDSKGQQVRPYFAFRTLTNTLDVMKEKAIPNRVDRTFLIGMSGAGQTQFIAGLKSLGLIDAGAKVQPILTELVEANPAERKRLLGEILRERYPEAIALGETNATTGELLEVFKEHYGVQGDTARKAIAFYLNAARYAGDIPLSPMFQTPKVSPGSGSSKKRKPKSNGGGEDNDRRGDNDSPRPLPEFHPILAGVLMEIPRRGRGWTQTRRDQVWKMLEMAVEFTIPIVDEEPEEEEEIEEEMDGLEH